MALYPAAKVRLLSDADKEPSIHPTCVIYHTAVSTGASLYAYFNRSDVNVESHFYVPKSWDLAVEQYQNTNRQADAQFDGNAYAISVESWDNADPDHVPWNDSQIERHARIAAWAHITHGIELTKAYMKNNVAYGIGYHAQFYVWNKTNHSCPGPVRIPQMPQIINRAKEIVAEYKANGNHFNWSEKVIDTLSTAEVQEIKDYIDKKFAAQNARIKFKVGPGLASQVPKWKEGDIVWLDEAIYNIAFRVNRDSQSLNRETVAHIAAASAAATVAALNDAPIDDINYEQLALDIADSLLSRVIQSAASAAASVESAPPPDSTTP